MLADRDNLPCLFWRDLEQDESLVPAFPESQFKGVCKAAALVGAKDQPVNNQIHLALHLPPGEEVRVFQFPDLTINAYPQIALLLQMGYFAAKNRRLGPQIGSKDHQPAALGFGENAFQTIIKGLLDNPSPVFRTIGKAAQRPQETGKIGYFRDRRHRTARIGPGARPLLNGNDRGQALDVIHFGPLDLLHDLPGPGGQAVHELPVSLRKKRVEGQ